MLQSQPTAGQRKNLARSLTAGGQYNWQAARQPIEARKQTNQAQR